MLYDWQGICSVIEVVTIYFCGYFAVARLFWKKRKYSKITLSKEEIATNVSMQTDLKCLPISHTLKGVYVVLLPNWKNVIVVVYAVVMQLVVWLYSV